MTGAPHGAPGFLSAETRIVIAQHVVDAQMGDIAALLAGMAIMRHDPACRRSGRHVLTTPRLAPHHQSVADSFAVGCIGTTLHRHAKVGDLLGRDRNRNHGHVLHLSFPFRISDRRTRDVNNESRYPVLERAKAKPCFGTPAQRFIMDVTMPGTNGSMEMTSLMRSFIPAGRIARFCPAAAKKRPEREENARFGVRQNVRPRWAIPRRRLRAHAGRIRVSHRFPTTSGRRAPVRRGGSPACTAHSRSTDNRARAAD